MAQPTKIYYFKVAFFGIVAGLTAGLVTIGLFKIGFGDLQSIGKLIFQSLVVAIIVGVILGFLNMNFKVIPFKTGSE